MSQPVSNELPRLAPGLVAREVAGDVVVVDPTTQTAHALSGPVADAWRALSSGERPAGSESEVAAVLGELGAKGLLEQSLMTRRLMLQRVGTVAIGTGLLMSISLPAVADSHSGTSNQTVVTTVDGAAVENPVPVGSTFSIRVTVSPTAATGGVVYLYRRGAGGAQTAVGTPPSGSTTGQASYTAGGVVFSGIAAKDATGDEVFDVVYSGAAASGSTPAYGSSFGTATVSYSKVAPTVTVTPSASQVNNGDAFSITVAVTPAGTAAVNPKGGTVKLYAVSGTTRTLVGTAAGSATTGTADYQGPVTFTGLTGGTPGATQQYEADYSGNATHADATGGNSVKFSPRVGISVAIAGSPWATLTFTYGDGVTSPDGVTVTYTPTNTNTRQAVSSVNGRTSSIEVNPGSSGTRTLLVEYPGKTGVYSRDSKTVTYNGSTWS